MALYLLFSHMFVILAKFDRVAPAATAPVQRTLSYDGGKREHSQERQHASCRCLLLLLGAREGRLMSSVFI